CRANRDSGCLISAGEHATEFHLNPDLDVAVGCGLLLGGLLFVRLLLGRLLLGGFLLSRPLFRSPLFSRLLPVLGGVSCRIQSLWVSLGVGRRSTAGGDSTENRQVHCDEGTN